MYIYVYIYIYRFLWYRISFIQRFRGSFNLLIADPCCFEAHKERRAPQEPMEKRVTKVMKAPTAYNEN